MSLLQVKDLNISSPDRAIIQQLSFSIEKSEILGLMGPSGCGKSTTALSLVKILPSSFQVEGSIFYDGNDILSLSREEIKKLRGRHFGFIRQDPFSALHPTMKVGLQIKEAPFYHKMEKRNATKWLSELTHFLQIDHLLSCYPYQLSGGERQRVCLAIALSCKPKILIADEPTTALDEELHLNVLNLLLTLRDRYELTIFFISHDSFSIEYLCDRFMEMDKGVIINRKTKKRGYEHSPPKNLSSI